MHWRSKWDYILVGDKRIITKFLLFPRCINGETRWLEKATYLQECVLEMGYGSMDYSKHKAWQDMEWIG